MKFFKGLVAATAISLGVAGTAGAATLTLVGGTSVAFGSGNYDSVCEAGNTSCYNPNGAAAGLTEDLQAFDSSTPGPGVLVTGSKRVKVTFLGYEAGKLASTETTSFLLNGSELFNKSSAVGDSYSFVASGVLDFGFSSNASGGTLAMNDGTFVGSASIGFSQIYDSRTVLAFFDDSGASNDRDYDDMVVSISAVPLPAGMLLLGTALAGFGLSRRRKAA